MTPPDNDAAAALRALASDDSARSKMGRLRALIDEIETAKSAGVNNRKIVETLNEHGFDLTLKRFEMMLYRIRKERGSVRRSGARPPPPAPAAPRQEETSPPDQDEAPILDTKQRRERLADQFIKPEVTNPLVRRIKERNK